MKVKTTPIATNLTLLIGSLNLDQMGSLRKIPLINDQIYHIYNRSIEHKPIFTTKWEYKRTVDTINYYQFSKLPIRFSYLNRLNQKVRNYVLNEIYNSKDKLVEIITYCLMPNHFHLLLKQLQDNGISIFVSNFTNSITKYINTKKGRKGTLFEGGFQSKLVETNEQLLHLSRYIHLNPTTSNIINADGLTNYEWSSLPEYLNKFDTGFCNKKIVLDQFKSVEEYQQFIYNQLEYARELDKIKHLTFE